MASNEPRGLVVVLKLDDPDENYALVTTPDGQELRVTATRQQGESAQKVRLVFDGSPSAFRVIAGRLLAKMRREPRPAGLLAAVGGGHGAV